MQIQRQQAASPLVRVGIPTPGGQLLAAAKARRYPVLFSANAFARNYPAAHERAGSFRRFSLPDPAQFEGVDAALDSAGFVAAVHYGDYRWTVDQYLDLVASHQWAWWASLDYCCESEAWEDRPTRLLRIAATAQMLGECRRLARARGLSMPMPVLQGHTPDEYVMCANWLPLIEWPQLVGLGSVCRRHVHGPSGVLAILEALDPVLPPHVRLHLFGLKGSALAYLAQHPRIASVDSMAWDMQARSERRTGRSVAFRAEHMARWADRQMAIAQTRDPGYAVPQSLLGADSYAGQPLTRDDRLIERLALLYADLVASGNMEYRDALYRLHVDAVSARAILQVNGYDEESRAMLDDLITGLGDFMIGGADDL